MKQRILAVLFALSALLSLSACGAREPAPTAPETEATQPKGLDFSGFQARDLEGNEVTGAIFSQAKVTMVNIWATTCPPCLREMPDLALLARQIQDFQVIGIVLDVTNSDFSLDPAMLETAGALIEETGASYLHLSPSESLWDLYLSGVQFVPTTLFFDENGRQLGQEMVGARSGAQWRQQILSLLEEAS